MEACVHAPIICNAPQGCLPRLPRRHDGCGCYQGVGADKQSKQRPSVLSKSLASPTNSSQPSSQRTNPPPSTHTNTQRMWSSPSSNLQRRPRLLPLALQLLAFLHTIRPAHAFATTSLRMMSSSASASASSTTASNDNIVIVGGGIMGACTLYYLTQKGLKPTLMERDEIAAGASGKSGGFLARSWHSDSTAKLYGLSFDMHAQLAQELGIESYRKITTLQVQGGPRAGQKKSAMKPSWLDGRADSAFMDDDTAQVTPREFTEKIVAAAVAKGAKVVKGTVVGMVFDKKEGEGNDDLPVVTGVRLEGQEETPVPCSKVVVATGPWAPVAGEWFGIPVPMEGKEECGWRWSLGEEDLLAFGKFWSSRFY